MIKVDQMVMLELCTMHHVPDQSGVFGNLDTNSGFGCPHRGQSVGVRSDATGSRHEMVRITRVAPLENQLDTAEQLARAPRVDDFASGHFHFDAKVALDSGDRIHYNSFTHIYNLPLLFKGYLSI
jgi:hypothetical protein